MVTLSYEINSVRLLNSVRYSGLSFTIVKICNMFIGFISARLNQVKID